jgi:ATP-dependent Lon protease
MQMMPISVGRPRSIAAMQAALMSEDKSLVVVSQRDSPTDDPKIGDLFHVGTLAVIERMQQAGNEIHALVLGIARLQVLASISEEPYLKAELRPLPKLADISPELA